MPTTNPQQPIAKHSPQTPPIISGRPRTHLESEIERPTRGNAPRGESALAVALRRGDDELALLADGHAEAALVPALDHAADARLVPVEAEARSPHGSARQ